MAKGIAKPRYVIFVQAMDSSRVYVIVGPYQSYWKAVQVSKAMHTAGEWMDDNKYWIGIRELRPYNGKL